MKNKVERDTQTGAMDLHCSLMSELSNRMLLNNGREVDLELFLATLPFTCSI